MAREPASGPSKGKPAAGRGTPPPTAPPAAAGAKGTVVLRAGPPPSQGRLANIVTGALGLLLLVASVYLVNALPKVDVPPNEFRITFETVSHNLTAQSAYLTDDTSTGGNRRHEFKFNITEDNVYEATFQLTFTDDIAASAPDSFRFDLRRPDGELEGNPDNVIQSVTSPLRANSSTEYEARPVTVTSTVVFSPKPQPAIITAREGATAEEVEAELTKRGLKNTAGTWTLTVNLDVAGDCIQPQALVSPANPIPNQDDIARFAACRRETTSEENPQGSGIDYGNEITVGVFTYSRIVVNAERFG